MRALASWFRVLDSGSSGSGSCLGPGRGHCVVFLGKTLYSHGPVKMLGVTLRLTSIPSTGSRNTPSRFML